MAGIPNYETIFERRVLWRIDTNGVQIAIPISISLNITSHGATSRHSMPAFIIQALLAFIQIQVAGDQPSRFSFRPVTTAPSVVGVLGYYLSFSAQRRLPTYTSQLSFAMSPLWPHCFSLTLSGISGSLSMSCLGSLSVSLGSGKFMKVSWGGSLGSGKYTTAVSAAAGAGNLCNGGWYCWVSCLETAWT